MSPQATQTMPLSAAAFRRSREQGSETPMSPQATRTMPLSADAFRRSREQGSETP